MREPRVVIYQVLVLLCQQYQLLLWGGSQMCPHPLLSYSKGSLRTQAVISSFLKAKF